MLGHQINQTSLWISNPSANTDTDLVTFPLLYFGQDIDN